MPTSGQHTQLATAENSTTLSILKAYFSKILQIRETTCTSRVGCPRNKQKDFSVRTETNRNSTCFGSFSVRFVKPINYFFGLFRFVSVFRIHYETTETNRSVSKQTEKRRKTGERSKINPVPHGWWTKRAFFDS
jgi:hypothetical protein